MRGAALLGVTGGARRRHRLDAASQAGHLVAQAVDIALDASRRELALELVANGLPARPRAPQQGPDGTSGSRQALGPKHK
jgi:hypothetical protein